MNRPRLILTIGPPGCGKTTYAQEYIKEHTDTIWISSDKIREELWGNEAIQGDNSQVFSLMQSRTIEALNDGKNVIYDCTNMTRKDRGYIIGVCPKFVIIEAHIIWTPIAKCIERDSKRDRTVGKEVIDRMLKKFQAPFFDEGIDEIVVVKPDAWDWEEKSYTNKCFEDMKIPHDNPHHTLDVIDHCWEAQRYLFNNDVVDSDLLFAALRHDIGKPYVKAFIDSKGNSCNIAHYYQHQCVGAYMSYGFDDTTPYVAWLISTHMDPYLNTKYYSNLPPFLKKDIDLLHEADRAAH